MYALPDAWNNNAKEYAYSVSLPIPLSDDVSILIKYSFYLE